LISAWVESNKVTMFDFDNCMFDKEFEKTLPNHLQWAKDTASLLIVVESHPFFPDDELYQQRKSSIVNCADDLNLPCGFFTSDYKLWLDQIDSKFTFHPDWYFRQKKWAKDNKYLNYDFAVERKYNFSCGNRSNYRTEKIYNYIECYHRRRADWLTTMYNNEHCPFNVFDQLHLPGLNATQLELWNNEIKCNLPYYTYDYDKFETYDNPHSTLFPVHLNSYCNLVMEHTMEVPILSEKSYKPFIAKQIPVYLAAIRAAEALKYLGFDLFYDFINHDNYDDLQINDWRVPENFTMRIDRVHQLIDKLYTTNFTEFFHLPETQARLQANQDYFYSDAIDQLCIKHFDKLLNKY
jgi:hypothetical protein